MINMLLGMNFDTFRAHKFEEISAEISDRLVWMLGATNIVGEVGLHVLEGESFMHVII
jgi:hypothetical protein